MKRAWWIGAWVAATAVVSFVTLQTLSFAEAGIGGGDLSPVVARSFATPVDAPDAADAPGDSHTTSTRSTGSDLSDPTTTTTSVAPATTADLPRRPSTSTSPLPPQTTVTVAVPIWEARTVESGGGTVTVRVAPGAVELVGAVPAPGFVVEVDDAGPTRVRVEFESDAQRFEVRIEWDGRELVISTD